MRKIGLRKVILFWLIIDRLLPFPSVPFRADVKNLSFDFKLQLPQLNFTGKYALKIKILLLDISGKGNVRGILCECIS